MKLAIGDSHAAMKAGIAQVLKASRRRCPVHSMSDARAHVTKNQGRVVSAAIASAFAQRSAEPTREQRRLVADLLRDQFTKFGELTDAAEHAVLAYMDFARPAICWSTPPTRSSARTPISSGAPTGLACSRGGGHRAPGRRDAARAERRVDAAAAPCRA